MRRQNQRRQPSSIVFRSNYYGSIFLSFRDMRRRLTTDGRRTDRRRQPTQRIAGARSGPAMEGVRLQQVHWRLSVASLIATRRNWPVISSSNLLYCISTTDFMNWSLASSLASLLIDSSSTTYRRWADIRYSSRHINCSVAVGSVPSGSLASTKMPVTDSS